MGVVMVGSARIDEQGHARGGEAGDQTGKEVSIQRWYLHAKEWRVFRPKDIKQADKIAQDMKWACDNNLIGYDQDQRNSLYNVAKRVGFNCKSVNVKTETDCSALVRVCCAYAGIKLPDFNTETEPRVLLDSGAFEEMKGYRYTNTSVYLRRGDILVSKTKGHTVVVLNDGDKYTAGDTVVVTGDSVYMREGPGKDYGIFGVVFKGAKFPYIKQENDWFNVQYGSESAWISKKWSRLL